MEGGDQEREYGDQSGGSAGDGAVGVETRQIGRRLGT